MPSNEDLGAFIRQSLEGGETGAEQQGIEEAISEKRDLYEELSSRNPELVLSPEKIEAAKEDVPVFSDRLKALDPATNPGFWENFGSSFALGKDQIEKSFWEKLEADAEQGVGFGSMISDYIGDDFIKARIEDNLADIERNRRELEAQFEEKPLEFSEIFEDPETFFSHTFPELLGQSIPMSLIPLSTTAIGALVGTAVAPGAGTAGGAGAGAAWGGATVGAMIGGGVGFVLGRANESISESGETYSRARQILTEKHPDWTEEQINRRAFVLSEQVFKQQMAVGLLDVPEFILGLVPAGKAATLVGKVGLKAAMRSGMKAMVKTPKMLEIGARVGGVMAFESTEEGIQYVINENAINQIQDEEDKTDLSWRGLYDDPQFIESIKAGAMLGLFMGTGMQGISAITDSKVAKFREMDFSKTEDQQKFIGYQDRLKNKFIHKVIASGKGEELIARISVEAEKKNGMFSDPDISNDKARIKKSKEYAKGLIEEVEQRIDILNKYKAMGSIANSNNAHYAYNTEVSINDIQESIDKMSDTDKLTKSGQEEIAVKEEMIAFKVDQLDRIKAGEDVHSKAAEEDKAFSKITDKFKEALVDRRTEEKTKDLFTEEEVEVIETDDIPIVRRKNAITKNEDGSLIVTGYRTEDAEGFQGVAQRGNGEYIAIDEPVPGEKVEKRKVKIDPTRYLIPQELEDEMGVVGAELNSEKFNEDMKTFLEEDPEAGVGEAQRRAYLEQGIEGQIGSLESEKGSQREIVRYGEVKAETTETTETAKEVELPDAGAKFINPKTRAEYTFSKVRQREAIEDEDKLGLEMDPGGYEFTVVTDKGERITQTLTPERYQQAIEQGELVPGSKKELLKKEKKEAERIEKEKIEAKAPSYPVVVSPKKGKYGLAFSQGKAIIVDKKTGKQQDPKNKHKILEQLTLSPGVIKTFIETLVSAGLVSDAMDGLKAVDEFYKAIEEEQSIEDASEELIEAKIAHALGGYFLVGKDLENVTNMSPLWKRPKIGKNQRQPINVDTLAKDVLGDETLVEAIYDFLGRYSSIAEYKRENEKVSGLGSAVVDFENATGLALTEKTAPTLAAALEKEITKVIGPDLFNAILDPTQEQEQEIIEILQKYAEETELKRTGQEDIEDIRTPEGEQRKAPEQEEQPLAEEEAIAQEEAEKEAKIAAGVGAGEGIGDPTGPTTEEATAAALKRIEEKKKEEELTEKAKKSLEAEMDALARKVNTLPEDQKPPKELISRLKATRRLLKKKKLTDEEKESLKKARQAVADLTKEIDAILARPEPTLPSEAEESTMSPEEAMLGEEAPGRRRTDEKPEKITVRGLEGEELLADKRRREAIERENKRLEELSKKASDIAKKSRGKPLMGMSPEAIELIPIWTEMASIYIKKGVRTASEFAKKLNLQLTDAIQMAWDRAWEDSQKTETEKQAEIDEQEQDDDTGSEREEDAEAELRRERVNEMIRDIPGLDNDTAKLILIANARKIREKIESDEKENEEGAYWASLVELGKKGDNEKILADHLAQYEDKYVRSLFFNYSSSDIYDHFDLVHSHGKWNIKIASQVNKKKSIKADIVKRFRDRKKLLTKVAIQRGYANVDDYIISYLTTETKDSKGLIIIPYTTKKKEQVSGWYKISDKQSPRAVALKRDMIKDEIGIFKLLTDLKEEEIVAYLTEGNVPVAEEGKSILETYIDQYARSQTENEGYNKSPWNSITRFVLGIKGASDIQGKTSLHSFKMSEFESLMIKDAKGKRSQADTIAGHAVDSAETIPVLSARNPSGSRYSTIMEDSMMSIRANEILDVADDNQFLKGNKIVEYFKEKKKKIKLFFMAGVSAKGMEGQDIKPLNFDEAEFTMLSLFMDSSDLLQNEDEYLHHMGQFGDKDKQMYVAYKKYSLEEAKAEFNRLRDIVKAKATKEEAKRLGFDSVKELKFAKSQLKEFPTREQLGIGRRIEEIRNMISEGLFDPSDIGKVEDMATHFALNIAINRHYSDQYFHGDTANYEKKGAFKLLSQFTKRTGSHLSNGLRLLTNIKGGLPKKLNLVIIEDNIKKSIFGDRDIEIPDGITIYREGLGKQMAVSMGEIYSKGDNVPFYKYLYSVNNPDGSVLTIKSMWSEVNQMISTTKGQKTDTIQAIKDYMDKHKIDVLTFDSGAKLKAKDSTTKGTWNKDGSFNGEVAPNIIEIESNKILAQTELRKEVKAKPAKHRRQFLRFIQSFLNSGSAILNELNEVYKQNVEREIDFIQQQTGKTRKDALLQMIPDIPRNEYVRSLIKTIPSFFHPHVKNFVNKVAISRIEKDVLQIKAKGTEFAFIPNIDQQLKPMRVENGVTLPAEILVPEDSGYNIGDEGFLMRAPIDGFQSGPYVKVVGFLPKGAKNQAMVDTVTAERAGWDHDGDKGFLWTKTTPPKGGFSEHDTRARVNNVYDMVMKEYKNPDNFGLLTDPIDTQIYDKITDAEKASDAVNKNTIDGYKAQFNSVKGSGQNIGIIARAIAVYLLSSRAGVHYVRRNPEYSKDKSVPEYIPAEINFPKIEKGKATKAIYKDLSAFEYLEETLNSLKNLANQNIDAIQLQKLEQLGLSPATVSMYMTAISLGVKPEHAKEFFTSPIVSRYNEIYRENKGAGHNLSDEEIFELLYQEEIKESIPASQKNYLHVRIKSDQVLSNEIADKKQTILYLRHFHEIAKKMYNINMLIHYSESLPKDNASQYDMKKILHSLQTGVRGLDLGNIREGSPIMVAMESSNKVIDTYVGAFDISQSAVASRILSEVELAISNAKQTMARNFVFSKKQAETFYRGLERLFYSSAFREEQAEMSYEETKKLVIDGFEQLIADEEFANNGLLEILHVENGKLQVLDHYKRFDSSEEQAKIIRDQFSALPEDFKNLLVLYNLYEYNLEGHTGRGGFSIYFDLKTQSEIAEKVEIEKNRWNAGMSVEEIDHLTYHLLINNPDLIPTLGDDFKMEAIVSSGQTTREFPKGTPKPNKTGPSQGTALIVDRRGDPVPASEVPTYIAIKEGFNTVKVYKSRPLLRDVRSGHKKGFPVFDTELAPVKTITVGEERYQPFVSKEETIEVPAVDTSMEEAPGTKKVNDTDVARFNKYLDKSKEKPEEFFTQDTTFGEFYNNISGKREKIPQSAIWNLNKATGNYDLVDKETAEIYISNVDLTTGRISEKPKHMLQTPVVDEELASEDPELQAYLEKEFKKLFPDIDVIFITNWRHEGMDVLGAAVGNTVFIDPTKSVQSTYFHEHAHIYWDALPENDSTKKKLMAMFETEEDAIVAIGKMGTEVAEEALRGFSGVVARKFRKGQFLSLMKLFWRKVKKAFGIKDQDHYVRVMSERIWTNKDGIRGDSMTGRYLEFQKAKIDDEAIEQMEEADRKIKSFTGKDAVDLTEEDLGELIRNTDFSKISDQALGTLPPGVTRDQLSFQDIVMRATGNPPTYVMEKKIVKNEKGEDVEIETAKISKLTGKAEIQTDNLLKYSINSQDRFGRNSIIKTKKREKVKKDKDGNEITIEEDVIVNIKALEGKTVEEASRIVKAWTTKDLEDAKKLQIESGSEVHSEFTVLQGYMKFTEDVIKMNSIFQELDASAFYKQSMVDLRELFRKLKPLDATARGPLWQALVNQMMAKELHEMIQDESKSGEEVYRLATLALHSIIMKENDVPMSKAERLFTSPKDMRNKMAQLWHMKMGVAYMASEKKANAMEQELLAIERQMRREGGKIENMIRTGRFNAKLGKFEETKDGNEYYLHPEDPEFARLKDSEQKWLTTYIRIVKKNLLPHKYEYERGMYRNVLEVKQVEADFFEIVKSHNLWKAIEVKLIGPGKYDQMAVKTKNGTIKTLGEAKRDIELDKINGVINKFKAVHEIHKLEKQAEKDYKRGVDASQNLIVNQPTSIPLPEIEVGREEFASKDKSASARVYLKALINKTEMEPMIPFALYFQDYFRNTENGGTTNDQFRTLITNINNQLIYKQQPDSAFGVYGKFIQAGVNYTAHKMLALNYVAPIFNISAALAGNAIVMDTKFFLRGLWRMSRHLRKSYNIMKKLNVVQGSIDAEKSLSTRYWKRVENVLFSTSIYPEYLNQGITFMGMMEDSEFDAYDKNGNVVDEKNALTPEREFFLQYNTNMIHGAYAPIFRREINLTPEGRALIQFKGWMPEIILRNLQNGGVDVFGQTQEGIMRTFFKPGLWKKITKKGFKMDDLTNIERRNLAKGLKTATIWGSLYAVILAMSEDDDDTPLVSGFNRALGDLTYVLDYDNIRFLIDAPVPMVSTVLDFGDAFQALITQSQYSRDGRFGKKGELKLWGKIADAGPYSRVLKKVMEE